MSKVILVTGGARSGKSNFAEKLCKDQNNNTAYIATSIPFDDEMKERVKKHKESRPQNWKTYEIYKDIYTIINDISKENEDLGFVDDYYAAEQVVNNIIGASKDDQKSNGEILNIGDLEPGSQAAIVGRIMSISNPKSFKTRKGKSGQV